MPQVQKGKLRKTTIFSFCPAVQEGTGTDGPEGGTDRSEEDPTKWACNHSYLYYVLEPGKGYSSLQEGRHLPGRLPAAARQACISCPELCPELP